MLTLSGIAVVLLAVYGSVVRHLFTRFAADAGDGAMFIWTYWHVDRAIGGPAEVFSTDLQFHPVGADLGFHTISPLWAGLASVLSSVVGLPGAINITNLTGVVLSAAGAYFLAFHLWRSRRAAALAALAFALLPGRSLRLAGHFNLNHTEFIPFGILALLLLYERPTRRRAAALGLVAAATVWTELNFVVLLGLALVVIAAVRWRETFTRPVITHLAMAGAVAVALSLPLIFVMGRSLVNHELDALPGFGGAEYQHADVLSWVTPPRRHPFWGHQFKTTTLLNEGERSTYPSFTVLALSIAGAFVVGRAARRVWLPVFATFFILSLGPFLEFREWIGSGLHRRGVEFGVPLPYLVIAEIPLLNGARIPGRFAIVGGLALAMLAAGLVARLRERRSAMAWIVSAVAIPLIVIELLPGPIPSLPVAVPEPYEAIAADAGNRAVLEIPLWWSSNGGYLELGSRGGGGGLPTIFSYYATRHGKPMVNGYVARYPSWRMQELTELPVYRQLLALEKEPGFVEPATFGVADLRRLDIGYIVIHDAFPEPAVEAYLATLALPVFAEGDGVTVFEVPADDAP